MSQAKDRAMIATLVQILTHFIKKTVPGAVARAACGTSANWPWPWPKPWSLPQLEQACCLLHSKWRE
jgi:hypothetical protein